MALETSGGLTATQAKQVLAEMLTSDASPEHIAADRGFEAMGEGALASVVDRVIAERPGEWEQYRSADDKGRKKLSGFFVGQVMKATNGQADGKAVAALFSERLTR